MPNVKPLKVCQGRLIDNARAKRIARICKKYDALSTREVCEMFGLNSMTTVHNWIHAGKIKALVIVNESAYMIQRKELKKFVKSQGIDTVKPFKPGMILKCDHRYRHKNT